MKPWEAPNHNQAHIYVTHEDRPWLNPSMVYQTDSEEVRNYLLRRLPLRHCGSPLYGCLKLCSCSPSL